MNNVSKFINLEPTAKGSVLKSDKYDFFKSINSEQGTSPCSSTSDKAIIARSIVWPFAYAQGVQSSLKLGRNLVAVIALRLIMLDHVLPHGTDR